MPPEFEINWFAKCINSQFLSVIETDLNDMSYVVSGWTQTLSRFSERLNLKVMDEIEHNIQDDVNQVDELKRSGFTPYQELKHFFDEYSKSMDD